MLKRALILDLDNTLYSWMDAFAPSLNVTIKYISKLTKLPFSEIRESFKTVFLLHNSVEVITSIEELNIWDKISLSLEERSEVQRNAHSLFLEEFQRRLQLFPDVEEVLHWAKTNGIMLIAFSDARAFWVNFRLRTLDISSLFDIIYALTDEYPNSSMNSDYPNNLIQYPASLCKPSIDMYLKILNDSKLSNDQVFIIGDSKRKDIRPASVLGLRNIWARYGTKSSSSNKRLMSSITPWTTSQRASGGNIKPQFTIDNFSEIVAIIENNWRHQ